MKKRLIASLVFTALSQPALADDWGIFAGVDLAKPNTSGDLNSSSLSLNDDWRFNGYVAVEHSIIFLPNVKLSVADFDAKGKSSASDLTLNLTSVDTTFYYQVLDNGILEVDLGVSLRFLDGDLHTLTNQSVSSAIPLAYGAAQVHIPNTGFSVFTELLGGSLTDDKATEAMLGLGYTLNQDNLLPITIRGGYRYQDLDLKDDVRLASDYSGAFVGLEVNF